MVGIKIEINIDDLINNHRDISAHDKVREIPMVDASYNNEWLNQEKVWWKIYKRGEDRWIRIEGRGEDCMSCHDIIFRKSPGNVDILKDNEEMCHHPNYGTISYDDYPGNMYVQSEKLRQLIDLGYEEGESNFVELIE